MLRPRKKAPAALPDILEARDIIKSWIHSCHSAEQLRNLQHTIQDLVVDRYARANESPYVIVHVSSYLHSLIRVRMNLVALHAAMV